MQQISTEHLARKVHELYPEIEFKSIQRLCVYGSRRIFALLCRGEDIAIKSARSGESFTIYERDYKPAHHNEKNKSKASERKRKRYSASLARSISWHYRRKIKRDLSLTSLVREENS